MAEELQTSPKRQDQFSFVRPRLDREDVGAATVHHIARPATELTLTPANASR
jgi:hypothetical protein